MDDIKLLEAMQGMIQENNKAIAQMMDEKLAAQEKRTDEKFRRLEEKINGVDMRLDKDFKEVKNLLKEDYDRVEKNAAKGAAAADRQKDTDSAVATLKHAVQNHNERITVLEEKAI